MLNLYLMPLKSFRESSDGSNVYDDQILKAKAEYQQILLEQFKI